MPGLQDVIALAQAQQPQNGSASVVENFLAGMNKSQDAGVERALKLIQVQQLQQDMERQARMEQEIQQQFAAQREQETQNGFRSVSGVPKAVLPTQKLKQKIGQDEKGRYSRSFEVVESDPSKTGVYTPEQVDAISSGDPKRLALVFPGGVPKEAVTSATSIGSREIDRSNKLAEQDERRILNIREGIKGSKSYRDWLEVKNASDNLLEAATNPSAKRSLGAIYSYIKALDQGSAVKGDEVKLAGEARSTANRLEGFFRKMATGELLLPEEVKEMSEWAKAKEKMARKNAVNSNKPDIEQAKRNKYDLKEINTDLFAETEDSGKETPEQRKARLLKEFQEAK